VALTTRNDPRWPTAIHEAGHAVVARELGRSVRLVSIEADEDGGTLGRMLGRPPGSWFQPDFMSVDGRVRHRLETEIMVSLAGAEAELRVSKEGKARVGAENDWRQAINLALYLTMGESKEAGAYVEWLRLRTINFINGHFMVWECIEALATRLLETPTLKGREVRESIALTKDATMAADLARWEARFGRVE
jgi:hypothetical protein